MAPYECTHGASGRSISRLTPHPQLSWVMGTHTCWLSRRPCAAGASMHHVMSSSLFLWGLLRKAEAWPSRLSLSLSLGPPTVTMAVSVRGTGPLSGRGWLLWVLDGDAEPVSAERRSCVEESSEAALQAGSGGGVPMPRGPDGAGAGAAATEGKVQTSCHLHRPGGLLSGPAVGSRAPVPL